MLISMFVGMIFLFTFGLLGLILTPILFVGWTLLKVAFRLVGFVSMVGFFLLLAILL